MKNPTLSADGILTLEVPYLGFDDQEHLGALLVNQSIATDVQEIFAELFLAKFPIEKMRPISDYNNDDEASMSDNNTSGYCYRFAVAKPGILSKHSFGLAIDVNPLYNPYVKGDLILPTSAKPYTDRSKCLKGMIFPGDACHTAFTKRGWIWGGSWPDRQDYQHFEVDSMKGTLKA